MNALLQRITKLASSQLNLLILGETGSGKELVARETHEQSLRRKGPFVAVNCAAIPESLLESTLFGHERGAFTGAVKAQAGKFSAAQGGTLFLDEIGDLPLELQAKILRAIQEKQIEPVGSNKAIHVDVRIVAATHQDLEQSVKDGKFRQDLYYRLNGATLKIPALRARRDDILPLARHFLSKGGLDATISAEAAALLQGHSWPGNVRELEQVIGRAALLCEGGVIQAADLELGSGLAPTSLESEAFWQSLKDAQAQFTHDYVRQALARNQGNRTQTAAQLGVSERSLYRILATADGIGSEA